MACINMYIRATLGKSEILTLEIVLCVFLNSILAFDN